MTLTRPKWRQVFVPKHHGGDTLNGKGSRGEVFVRKQGVSSNRIVPIIGRNQSIGLVEEERASVVPAVVIVSAATAEDGVTDVGVGLSRGGLLHNQEQQGCDDYPFHDGVFFCIFLLAV